MKNLDDNKYKNNLKLEETQLFKEVQKEILIIKDEKNTKTKK